MSDKTSDKKASEVIPCPFCGMRVMVIRNRGGVLPFAVECGRYECQAMTKYFPTEEEAIDAWNTRKPMERILERLEERHKNHEAALEKYDLSSEYEFAVRTSRMKCENEISIEIVKEEGGLDD